MPILTINGKMYSGKTTTADMIIQRVIGSVSFGVGDLIREEAKCAFKALDYGASADEVASRLSVGRQEAVLFIKLMAGATSVYDRTDGNRKALQLLGSEWRPEGYWPLQVVSEATRLAESHPLVVVSGVRMPDEHSLFEGIATRVRLDVSEGEQSRRAAERDGVSLGEEIYHFGEVALDTAQFDVRFKVDSLTPEEVTAQVLESVLKTQEAGVL